MTTKKEIFDALVNAMESVGFTYGEAFRIPEIHYPKHPPLPPPVYPNPHHCGCIGSPLDVLNPMNAPKPPNPFECLSKEDLENFKNFIKEKELIEKLKKELGVESFDGFIEDLKGIIEVVRKP